MRGRTIQRNGLSWIAAAFFLLFWLTPDARAANCLTTFVSGGRTYYIHDAVNVVPNCTATGGVLFSIADYNAINSNFATLTNNLAASVAVNNTQQVSINSLNASIATINAQLGINQTTQQNFANSLAATNAQVASLTTGQAVLTAPFDLPTALAAFAFFFSTTLFFYTVARMSGAILEKIRKPMGHG